MKPPTHNALFSASRIVLYVLVGLALLLPLTASAQSNELWTPASTGSQNWNLPANWGGTVPNGTAYKAYMISLLNNSTYTINQNIGAGVTLGWGLIIDLGSTANTISVALSGNSITLGSAAGPTFQLTVQNVGSASSLTVGNNLVFAAPSTTFGIPGAGSNVTAPTFTGVLSGTGNVTVGGTTIVLNNTSGTASSQSGAWGVQYGVLSLGNSNSAGSASYTLNTAGQVKFANASNDAYTNLFAQGVAATGTIGFLGVGGVTNTLTNMGDLAGGTFSFLTSGGTGNTGYKITTANWSPTAALTVTGSTLELASASGIQALSGNITGTGALVRSTAGGTSVLSGTNTYSGGTTVTGGTLVTTKAAALPGYGTSGKVVVNGGTLGVQVGSGWTTAQVDSLLGNATKTSGALGIDTTNGDVTQWAAFTTSNLGGMGITKLGANTLSFSAINSYTGATTVWAGTLLISGGNINSTSVIAVNSGATLTSNSGTACTASLALTEGSTLSGTGSFAPTAMTLTANLTDGFATIALGNFLTRANNIESHSPA